MCLCEYMIISFLTNERRNYKYKLCAIFERFYNTSLKEIWNNSAIVSKISTPYCLKQHSKRGVLHNNKSLFSLNDYQYLYYELHI